jgi:hypothetical protein
MWALRPQQETCAPHDDSFIRSLRRLGQSGSPAPLGRTLLAVEVDYKPVGRGRLKWQIARFLAAQNMADVTSAMHCGPCQGRARKIEFVEPDQSDLPCPVPPCKNISLCPSGKSSLELPPSCPERGALRNVINGGGMRWTRQHGLTNGADPPSLKLRRTASKSADTFGVDGRGRRSRVVLTPRRRRQVGGNRFPPMTVTNKPDHRGEHEGNR